MVEIIDAEIVINELQHKGIIHLTEENIDRKRGRQKDKCIFYMESLQKICIKDR